jgi:exonuclease SbcD
MLEEAGAFVIAAVSVRVERSDRRRLVGVDQELLEGLTPRRALELYLQNKQPSLSSARIAALLTAADELIQGS